MTRRSEGLHRGGIGCGRGTATQSILIFTPRPNRCLSWPVEVEQLFMALAYLHGIETLEIEGEVA